MNISDAQAWGMYLWAAVVAVAVVIGALSAARGADARADLPIAHVAAAALLGSFGWEMLIQLPGSIVGYWGLTAGLGDVRGDESHQAFLAAQAAFVVASVCAVFGLLRRRPWGAVLGIGLVTALGVFHVLTFIQYSVEFGSAIGDGLYLNMISTVVAGRVVPVIVTISLLAWPLLRRDADTPTRADRDADWSAATAPDAGR